MHRTSFVLTIPITVTLFSEITMHEFYLFSLALSLKTPRTMKLTPLLPPIRRRRRDSTNRARYVSISSRNSSGVHGHNVYHFLGNFLNFPKNILKVIQISFIWFIYNLNIRMRNSIVRSSGST